ncbi:MAG: type VI secretion system contractile sheath large subunit [Chitinivibrionales bacterium]|nr:type VI secretion system contractile sheath large subunit [Chitinivibrionales bacterium]
MNGQKIPHDEMPPWHMLIVDVFVPNRIVSEMYSIDKNSFNAVLQSLSPSISFSVPDILNNDAKSFDVAITIKSLKDFTPDSLVLQIPQLNTLVQVKEKLKKVTAGLISADEFNQSVRQLELPGEVRKILDTMAAIQQPKTVPETPVSASHTESGKKSSLSSILEQIDFGANSRDSQTSTGAGMSALNSFIAAVTDEYVKKPAAAGIDGIITQIEVLMSRQLDEIMHAKPFLGLERSWRSLKFLIDKNESKTKGSLQFSLCSCEKDVVDTVLLEQIFRCVWKSDCTAPDVIVLLHSFNNSPSDFQIIENVARCGRSTQTVVIAWAGPEFFSVRQFTDLPASAPNIELLLADQEYDRWRSFREKSESEWLVFSTNSFCLRERYGSQGVGSKYVHYEECVDSASALWSPASVAVASLIAQLISQLGSEYAVSQPLKPELQTPALFTISKQSAGRSVQKAYSCQLLIDRDNLWKMIQGGLLPINGQTGSMRITLSSTETYGANGLSFMTPLLAGHICRSVSDVVHKQGVATRQEMIQRIESFVNRLVLDEISHHFSQPCVSFEIKKDPDTQNDVCSLVVVVPYTILGEQVSIEAEFALPAPPTLD